MAGTAAKVQSSNRFPIAARGTQTHRAAQGVVTAHSAHTRSMIAQASRVPRLRNIQVVSRALTTNGARAKGRK